MNQDERERMKTMVGVQARELTLVQATELLGVSYRQSKRIWRPSLVAATSGRTKAAGDSLAAHCGTPPRARRRAHSARRRPFRDTPAAPKKQRHPRKCSATTPPCGTLHALSLGF